VQELSNAIKNLKEVQMLKTELDEEEQKARIAKLRHDVEADEVDNTIEIVMGEDVSKYAN
jgi:hypothetical protein